MADGSFTGSGQNSASVFGNMVDTLLIGAFSATMQLQTKVQDGTWLPFGANITAAGMRVDQSAASREWRLSCTAYTSGSPIKYEINGMKDNTREPAFST